jgi:hypothetical protein
MLPADGQLTQRRMFLDLRHATPQLVLVACEDACCLLLFGDSRQACNTGQPAQSLTNCKHALTVSVSCVCPTTL